MSLVAFVVRSPLRFISFIMDPEIQPRAEEVDLVLADLIAQETPRCTVMLERHGKLSCKIAQS